MDVVFIFVVVRTIDIIFIGVIILVFVVLVFVPCFVVMTFCHYLESAGVVDVVVVVVDVVVDVVEDVFQQRRLSQLEEC